MRNATSWKSADVELRWDLSNANVGQSWKTIGTGDNSVEMSRTATFFEFIAIIHLINTFEFLLKIPDSILSLILRTVGGGAGRSAPSLVDLIGRLIRTSISWGFAKNREHSIEQMKVRADEEVCSSLLDYYKTSWGGELYTCSSHIKVKKRIITTQLCVMNPRTNSDEGTQPEESSDGHRDRLPVTLPMLFYRR